MKAFITDIVKFSFFTIMVAAFAGVGAAIAKVIGLVPHRAPATVR
jgi:hypothetical protein